MLWQAPAGLRSGFKTGGVPPKPLATILLSVGLSVLRLRFVAASFWPAVAATALKTCKDDAASLLPTVAAGQHFTGDWWELFAIALPHDGK